MKMFKRLFSLISIVSLSQIMVAQQIDNGGSQASGQTIDYSEDYRVITTAVPFMTITPDSRGGGMGDVGVASSVDVWSQFWNPAKYATSKKDLSVGVSYTPWLAHLTSDINLAYIAGYKKLESNDAVAASLRYFSLGEIPAYDENGSPSGYTISPREFAIDMSYSRLLSEKFSIAVVGRYINSDLTGKTDPETKTGQAAAADIAGLYFSDIVVSDKKGTFSAGLNISNLGNKISYSADQKDFIPTNMRLGLGTEIDIDAYNKFGIYLDINKLLVPTDPVKDSTGTVVVGGEDNSGASPIVGVFKSFGDAPGGFSEEIKEFMWSLGAEYWYNKQFALRGGYFHEAETKGNRKFFSLGVGMKMNVIEIDLAYLVPLIGTSSPLANTFRFSLTFDFDQAGK